MGFNSKAYLDYEERRLEPDQQLRGTYRRWPELRKPATPELIKPMVRLSEEEDNKKQDEYLKSKGVC